MEEKIKKDAYDLAVSLGLEIYSNPNGGKGCTSWRYGMRGSADQYCKLFDSAEDAAVHFLTTREAQTALRNRDSEDLKFIELLKHATTG